MKKKIGLFGGTFNPPHLGHLIIAQEALSQLKLDEVWWLPAAKPPHKEEVKEVTDKERIEMVKRTIGNNRQFSLSLFEFERSGPSYTIDTMRDLKKKYPAYDFTFIMGGDMVHSLDQWHEIEELSNLVQFAGVDREGYDIDLHWKKYNVKKVIVPHIAISSTFIRDRIRSKENFRYFVSEEVWLFIGENRLYGEE